MKRMQQIVVGSIGVLALVGVTAFAAGPDASVGTPCGPGGGFGGGHGGMGMMYGGAGPGGYRGMGGMGAGMMGGWQGGGRLAALDLSDAQRKQIAQIAQETAQARQQLMASMHQQRWGMGGMFGPGAVDEQAARKAFDSMTATRKAMFELALTERQRIDAVLTPAQRSEQRAPRQPDAGGR